MKSTPAEDIDRVLSPELMERINAPIADATGLPNAAYTSPDFLEMEQRYIFRRSWMLAGELHLIPNNGDLVPVEVAGMPLLLVRDHDHSVRVFQNVCRHRGARLVAAPCKAQRSIVCPYHAWTYALDGSMQRRPHFYGGDRHDVISAERNIDGLIPVRSEIWHHWIMVNIDGNAPPLADHFAHMDEQLIGYDFSAAIHAGTLEFKVDTNWKFAHENYIEPYHVFAAHPRLRAFVPMRERQPSKVSGHLMWNYYQFQSAQEGRGLGLPHFPGLSAELSMRGIWFLVFPSFGIEIYPDHIALFHVNPIAPDKSVEKISIYLIGDAASSDRYRAGRQAVLDMWQELNTEDIALLEALQRGRSAPGYDGGMLSPYWDEAPRSFARLIAETIRRESRNP